MVVFLDLDEDASDDGRADPHRLAALSFEKRLPFRNNDNKQRTRTHEADAPTADETKRDNPNLNATSAAFGCYPYASPFAVPKSKQ